VCVCTVCAIKTPIINGKINDEFSSQLVIGCRCFNKI
jgi:hypothetical protein